MEIRPNDSIGPFKLLSTLRECWQFIRKPVKILDHSHALVVQTNNLSLIFDPCFNRLILIEANSPYDKYFYHKETFKYDFRSIYNRLLGPTYPGILSNGNYYLSYPGICFKFESIKELPSDKIIENLSTSSIAASSFVIYKSQGSKSWEETSCFLQSLMLNANPYQFLDFFNSKLSINNSSIDQSKIEIMIAITNLSGLIWFKFKRHPKLLSEFTLKLNLTTQQEIIEILGPPESTIIHKKSSHPNSIKSLTLNDKGKGNGMIKIHNYFSLGIDVIYSTTALSEYGSPVVSKIILHNNLPQSVEFMHYERLNVIYDLSFNPHVLHSFNNSMATNYQTWDQIKNCLSLPQGKKIFLNRKEYDVNDDFDCFEFIGEKNKRDDRGVSELIGAFGIWEIMRDGKVSSLTLY